MQPRLTHNTAAFLFCLGRDDGMTEDEIEKHIARISIVLGLTVRMKNRGKLCRHSQIWIVDICGGLSVRRGDILGGLFI